MKDVEGIDTEQVLVLERLKQNQRQDYLKVRNRYRQDYLKVRNRIISRYETDLSERKNHTRASYSKIETPSQDKNQRRLSQAENQTGFSPGIAGKNQTKLCQSKNRDKTILRKDPTSK